MKFSLVTFRKRDCVDTVEISLAKAGIFPNFAASVLVTAYWVGMCLRE